MSGTKLETRELGYMTIANDRIFVIERKIAPAVVQEWINRLDGAALKTFRHIPEETDLQWCALAPADPDSKYDGFEYNRGPYRMVAYASLRQVASEEVRFVWAVVEEFRGLGLGKLMARFATDMAIRYRNRKISAVVDYGHATAINILEMEDFDISTPIDDHESMSGKVVKLVKELRWQ